MVTSEMKKVSVWRQGWVVFAVLAVLTLVEFGISVGISQPWPWLTVVALVKAGLIVNYFMRFLDLSVLWRKEAEK
jgi:cytochrome c oxidase subunit IV